MQWKSNKLLMLQIDVHDKYIRLLCALFQHLLACFCFRGSLRNRNRPPSPSVESLLDIADQKMLRPFQLRTSPSLKTPPVLMMLLSCKLGPNLLWSKIMYLKIQLKMHVILSVLVLNFWSQYKFFLAKPDQTA